MLEDEFDLCNFTTIEHSIQTGQAKPVKERMRCMPTCFASEEEAYLKMLATGVIQPSISDLASAQVLIRKRDGNVRWFIDSRGLNSMTEKDVLPLPPWTPWRGTNGSQSWTPIQHTGRSA